MRRLLELVTYPYVSWMPDGLKRALRNNVEVIRPTLEWESSWTSDDAITRKAEKTVYTYTRDERENRRDSVKSNIGEVITKNWTLEFREHITLKEECFITTKLNYWIEARPYIHKKNLPSDQLIEHHYKSSLSYLL